MLNLLYFSIEGVRCAIPIDDVRSVSRMVELTRVVDEGDNIAGTINFHGTVIPVYSMRRIFGFPERLPHRSDVLIITCTGKKSVALWVDKTLNVKEGPEIAADIDDFPGLHITIDGEIVIHDLDMFLGSGELSNLYETLALAAAAREGDISNEVMFLPRREIDPEKVVEILSDRAEQLAQPGGEAVEGAPIDILTFRLMYQEYAIEMDYIREVTIHEEITPVPGAPEYIAGICAIRGEIISLVDLRILFDLPEKGLTDLNRVIVLTDDAITFGILADYITDIGTITADQISPSVNGKTSMMDRYLKGMVWDSIIMLDAAKILSDPAMVVDDI